MQEGSAKTSSDTILKMLKFCNIPASNIQTMKL